jgi:hypothetical protein
MRRRRVAMAALFSMPHVIEEKNLFVFSLLVAFSTVQCTAD